MGWGLTSCRRLVKEGGRGGSGIDLMWMFFDRG